ncbi:MAG: ABC transporter permease [Firmicutes bacterium]|nr:ABC transporter permease [Bacillota bacterium]
MTDPRFELVGAKPQAEAAPQKMRRHRPPYSTAVLLALIVLPCLLAEVVMTRDPAYMDLAHCLVAPCREFIFGTDSLGRDIFSMIWYGGRISLTVGFLATVIATALAMIIGSLSALAPRWLDALLMHITDILLSVPSLLLVLFLQAFFRQNSVFTLSIVLGITGWMGMSRVVRTEVLQLRGCEYMEAARLMGGSFFYLLRRHLAPNFIPSLMFMAVMQFRSAVMAEATLSFIGLGLPLEVVSWGSMLSLAQQALLTASWWVVVIPGAFLLVTLVCVTNIGNHLRKVHSHGERNL